MFFYKTIKINMKKSNGQAALSTMLVIGGLISLIALTLIVVIFSYISSSYGFQYSQKAFAVANAGADDALIQLIRNKSFENQTGYSVNVSNDIATVQVVQNSPQSGQVTIISTANVLNYKSKVKVVVSIDSNGEVRIIKREKNN
jgi:hypothetical protein